MKKLISLILTLCLFLSFGATAMAAEVNSGTTQSANTTVTYGLDSSFTVIIPESVAIDSDTQKGTATVAASDVMLNYGDTLNVTITGIDTLVDTADANNTLTYQIGKADGTADVTNDTVVLSVESGNTVGGEQDLFFELTQPVTKSGSYTDTLTFVVSVE